VQDAAKKIQSTLLHAPPAHQNSGS
jgi:hypothetical protein